MKYFVRPPTCSQTHSRIVHWLRCCILMVLLTTPAAPLLAQTGPSQASQDLAQQMYVAYYGRPGDPGGLAFWATTFNESTNLDEALVAFGDSPEFTERFGSFSDEELITGLFQQLFNRNVDSEGLAFYLGRLQDEAATLASIAKQIADGALASDLLALDNKIAVANEFSARVETDGIEYTEDDIPAAQTLLAGISGAEGELEQGLAAVDVWLAVKGVEAGEMVYRLRRPSGNNVACVNCHALEEPAANGFMRAGHQIGDATRRPSYKNGQLSSMLDAVNSCLQEWMIADPWTDSSPEWLALFNFLDANAPEEQSEAIQFSVVSPPIELSGGDASAGQEMFNTSCAMCHDLNGVGSDLAPRIAGLGLDPDYIARRIRTSGSTSSSVYEGLTGGVMPFWSAERLDDTVLKDLVAYVSTSSGDDASDEPEPEPDPDPGDDDSCTASHPRVGQVAELTRRFHNVSGTATITDDCTIVVSNFNYDGEGIRVKFYAGNGGEYQSPNGFPISRNIKGTVFTNDTFVITLKDTISLDDFDGISVWCINAGVSFGDGVFTDP